MMGLSTTTHYALRINIWVFLKKSIDLHKAWDLKWKLINFILSSMFYRV